MLERSSSVLLFASALAAQTQVIPATFATTAAASSTGFPFGGSTPARVQYLYGAAETGLSAPVVIRTLNLRAQENSTFAAKANIDLQISLSTTAVTVGTATSTFANNHGANVSVAYVRKLTSLNAVTPTTPGGFGGAWPLDVPFPYDPAAGNLLVDFDVASQPAGSWSMDTPFTTAGTHVTQGTGCNGAAASSTGGALGGPLTFTLSAGGTPNGVALLLAGFNLFPAPIPVPGSPGCNVYNDFPILVAATLSGTGVGSVPLTVPPDASLRGGIVYGQFAAITAALGVNTTNSRQVTLASWVVLRVHNTANNASPTGTVQNYVGIVIELGF
jgi:hypothetical protein